MDAMDERARTVFSRLYQHTAHAEGEVPISTFENHEVVDSKLYLVFLGFRKPRWQFGRPKLAEGELAEKIIGRWVELSKTFGTKIDFVDGVEKVRL
jgi:hypothetical protein